MTRKTSSDLLCSAKVSHIQPMNDSLPYCTGRECSSYFSQLLQTDSRRMKWIFHSSLILRPNWLLISISLSITGDSCMPKSVAAVTAAHISVLIDSVLVVARHTKPRLMGERTGWSSEDAVTHLGSWYTRAAERGSTRAHLLASCLSLNISHKILYFCHQLEWKRIREGRLFHSSIWSDQYGQSGMMSSASGSENTGIVWGNKRKESSYCDPEREKQPFWLLSPRRVLHMLCGFHGFYWQFIDFLKLTQWFYFFFCLNLTTAHVCSCESKKVFGLFKLLLVALFL